VLLGLQFLHGLATFTNTGWLTCVLIAAATLNLFVFLGRDIASRIRSRNARMLRRFQEVQQKQVPRHTCCVCGVTNLSNPEREFRYCTQCDGAPAYCDLHLKDHVHRTKAPAAGL
jgi:ribosomal protein L37AE/L43A